MNRQGRQSFACLSNLISPGRLVRTIPKEYRRRWGIETSFRKVKALSLSPAIGLAYYVTAMILYNLWQATNLMLRAEESWW